MLWYFLPRFRLHDILIFLTVKLTVRDFIRVVLCIRVVTRLSLKCLGLGLGVRWSSTQDGGLTLPGFLGGASAPGVPPAHFHTPPYLYMSPCLEMPPCLSHGRHLRTIIRSRATSGLVWHNVSRENWWTEQKRFDSDWQVPPEYIHQMHYHCSLLYRACLLWNGSSVSTRAEHPDVRA